MKQTLNYGSLPIQTITEFVTEIDGEKFPLEPLYSNSTREVPNLVGTYILKPGKIYTAITKMYIPKEDLSKVEYDYFVSPILCYLCIKPNLIALPINENGDVILAYTFNVIEPLKVNINKFDLGNIHFSFDDEDIPLFIKDILGIRDSSDENIPPTQENVFDEENDKKILDNFEKKYKENVLKEEIEEEQDLSEIFNNAANKFVEGSEECDIELEE